MLPYYALPVLATSRFSSRNVEQEGWSCHFYIHQMDAPKYHQTTLICKANGTNGSSIPSKYIEVQVSNPSSFCRAYRVHCNWGKSPCHLFQGRHSSMPCPVHLVQQVPVRPHRVHLQRGWLSRHGPSAYPSFADVIVLFQEVLRLWNLRYLFRFTKKRLSRFLQREKR